MVPKPKPLEDEVEGSDSPRYIGEEREQGSASRISSDENVFRGDAYVKKMGVESDRVLECG